MNKFKLITGVVLALVLSIGVLLTSMIFSGDEPLRQAEVAVSAMADRTAPSANNNPMEPVVIEEAERRTSLHVRVGEEQVANEGNQVGYIAPPVVTEIRSATGEDALTQKLFGGDFIITPPARVTEPEPEPVVAVVEPEPKPEPEPEAVVEIKAEPTISQDWMEYYRNRRNQPAENLLRRFDIKSLEAPSVMPMEQGSLSFGDYMSDPDFLRRAHARNDALDSKYYSIMVADGPNSNIIYEPVVRPQYAPTTQPYSAPILSERSAARPPMVAVGPNGQVFTTSQQPNPYARANAGPIVLARSGDLLYASLLYGFDNTDVRGLPIYAVITDYLPNGTLGPLNGAKIQGQVRYTREDASIVFNQAILPNGLEIQINAVAVSSKDGRTGVAQNVNRHTISRYGSLFLAGIISGIGEVAQFRLRDQGGDTTIINTGGGTVTSTGRHEPTDGEIIAGAVAPIGKSLSSIARDNFNRDFTITANAGMGFSLVFLATVVTDPSDVTGRAFNPRTQRFEAVRLNNEIPAGGAQQQQGTPIPQAIQDAVNGQRN